MSDDESKFGNNPFADALKNFKPETPDQPVPDQPVEEQLSVAKDKTQEVTEGLPIDSQEKPRYEGSADLSKEEAEMFEELIRLLNVSIGKTFKNDQAHLAQWRLEPKTGDSRRYWRIRKLILDSSRADITYDLNRWIGSHKSESGIREICNTLLIKGYEAQAVSFLQSLSPERMKYGPPNQTPEEKRASRIVEAENFAEKAGMVLEEIADKHGLSYLLKG